MGTLQIWFSRQPETCFSVLCIADLVALNKKDKVLVSNSLLLQSVLELRPPRRWVLAAAIRAE